MLESEFQHVLHTNYAPTEAEAQKIRDFCVAPEAEVAKLETEIARLEAALAAVRRRRDEINDIVIAHRALLSPIRGLSPELLQNVFASCLAEFPAMHASEAPLLLGRVCKHWRDIVYSTAELWSTVHAVLPSTIGSQDHRLVRLEALKEWLSRSGNRPLRISLYDESPADESDILDLIIPVSPRWEQIVFTVMPAWFQRLECSFSGISALPLLRFFGLRDYYRVTRNEPPSVIVPPSHSHYNPLHLLSLCPNVELISVHLSSDNHRAFLPHATGSSLRELDVSFPATFDSSLGQFLGFLAPCQNLLQLRVLAFFEDSTLPPSLPLITLPALQCLIVDMRSLDNRMHTFHFLDRLIAPNLHHLGLKNTSDVTKFVLSLGNFFTRSLCPLRTLSLELVNYMNYSANRDLRLLLLALKSANDIKELNIHRDEFVSAGDDELLLGLAYANGFVNYCPKMTHFKLSFNSGNPDLRSLLTLLRSRMDPPLGCVALQVVDLTNIFPRSLDPVDTEPLLNSISELQEQGLSVSLPQPPIENLPPVLPMPNPWTGMPRRRSNSLLGRS